MKSRDLATIKGQVIKKSEAKYDCFRRAEYVVPRYHCIRVDLQSQPQY
jgi:hypothetical protein